MDNYEKMTDEQLVLLAREGDNRVVDYIMEKYKNLVKKKAHAMYILGGDTDDLIQEGMIGLFKAVRDYKEDKEASFLTFADLCVSRQIYNAVSASKRKKHIPLNTYISLYSDSSDEENESTALINNIYISNSLNPEDMIIDKENEVIIEETIDESLSSFEKEVIDLYIAGVAYSQIAAILERTPKSVDNAIQRIRTKLSPLLS